MSKAVSRLVYVSFFLSVSVLSLKAVQDADVSTQFQGFSLPGHSDSTSDFEVLGGDVCTANSNCSSIFGDNYVCTDGACVHRPLLPGFSLSDGFGLVVCFLGVALSASAGVGGGGVMVPLFMMVMQFRAKEAIPLSKATIFGGAIANLLWNIRRRHPTADRPLIDVSIALIFEPMALAGTIAGVFLNRVFPSWLIVMALLVLLVITTWKTLKSARKRRANEVEQARLKQLGVHKPENNVNDENSSDSPLLRDSRAAHASDSADEKALLAPLPPVADSVSATASASKAKKASKPKKKAAKGGGAYTEITTTDDNDDVDLEEGQSRSDDGQNSLLPPSVVRGTPPSPLSPDPDPTDMYSKAPFMVLSTPSGKGSKSNGSGAVSVAASDSEHVEHNSDKPPLSSFEIVAPELGHSLTVTKQSDPLPSTLSTVSPALQAILDSERKFNIKQTVILTVCWVTVMTMSLVKGSHGSEGLAGIACASAPYWLLVIVPLPLMLAVTWAVGRHLQQLHQTKLELGYVFHEGDIKWTRRNATVYPAINYVAGLMAGLVGIGGGMVQGPILMALELHPQVGAAASAFMLLYTSGSTAGQFLIFGMMQEDYGLMLGITGFVASVIGQYFVDKYIAKTGRQSIIIFIMAFVIGFSSIFMAWEGIGDLVKNRHAGSEFWSFHDPCSASGNEF